MLGRDKEGVRGVMERLTHYYKGEIAAPYNRTQARNMVEQLAEYEDAEEAGLLVRLPCKVGDTLYTNQTVSGWYLRKVNRPFPVDVCFIGINGQDNFFNVDYRCGHMAEFKFSDIGKTIYLTKEEAEQALKEAGGKDV